MKVPLKVRSSLSIVLSLILGAASYAVVRHLLVSASGENAESTARTYQFRNSESVKSGRGHFRIAGTSRNPGDRRAVTEGAQFAVRLPALVANLNSWISLPRNLEIRSEKCGQADAYYDDAAGNIVVCSELEDQFYNYFLSKRSTPEQARNAALRAMKLVFFHEVGHAVIGMWDLPSTGREEDAADQFAVLTALKADPDGDQTIYDGANSLKMYIDRAKKDGPAHT